MNVHFKRFVICVCICCSLVVSARPQPANAVVPFVVVAGAEVSLEAVAVLSCATLVAYDCITYKPTISKSACDAADLEIGNIVSHRWSQVSNKADLVRLSVSDTGKKFLNWTAEGLTWFGEQLSDIAKDPTVTVSGNDIFGSLGATNWDLPCTVVHTIPALSEGTIIKITSTLSDGTLKTGSYVVSSTYATLGVTYQIVQGWGSQVMLKSVERGGTFTQIGIAAPGSSYHVNISNSIPLGIDNFLNPARSFDYGNAPDVLPVPQDVSIPLEQPVSPTGVSLPYAPPGSASDDVLKYPWSGVPDIYHTPTGAFPSADSIPNTGSDTNTCTGEGTIDKDKGIFSIPILGDILKTLQKILDVVKDIPTLLQKILDWFKVDTGEIAKHIDYTPILRTHLKPFYDITDLLKNIQSNPNSCNGKFYMVIPVEMGGDGQEHCVLDLSVGSVYISTGREIIKYGIWIAFLWFVLRAFSPKFNI